MKRKVLKILISVFLILVTCVTGIPNNVLDVFAASENNWKQNIQIKTINEEYDGSQYNLVTVEGCEADDVILYSTDKKEWMSEAPAECDVGEYAIYVKIQREGYLPYISDEQTAIIKQASLEKLIQVTQYVGEYDGNYHTLINLNGLEVGDEVILTCNDKTYEYVYGVDKDNLPNGCESGDYEYTLKVHRNDNYMDYVTNGVVEIQKATSLEDEKNVTIYSEDVDKAWDGVTIQEPELIGYEYHIDTAEKLAWFANEVNNNKNTFDGKSIFITGEIDLNNHAWSVIGNKNYPLEIHGNIVMQNAKIMGLHTSSGYAYNYGLFGNVKIWGFSADNLQMKNAHMNATTKDYDGILFGQLEVARNGKCSIVNSEFSGDMAGDSQCGAIIGCINGKSENAEVSIQNCTTKVDSTDYRTLWNDRKYNAALKAGLIARYNIEANNNALILNGVICDDNLAGYTEYGYDDCTVGGMIGLVEGKGNIFVYQCGVEGIISSSGYCGFAGGIVGHMVSCDTYKQSDCYVTATINASWNAYGYPYNAGGFIEGPTGKSIKGYIKKSYFAGQTGSCAAFVAKDGASNSEQFKIYNCYYNGDLCKNHVMHTNWSCYIVENTTVDCARYTTGQMKQQENFHGWDFVSVWDMGGQQPELRREKFVLPDDFEMELVDDNNKEIVKIVREYTSQEFESKWEEIEKSDLPTEVKFDKILALATYYGITDPKEGLEFVIKSQNKRWAYNTLVADDGYTASLFLDWLNQGGHRALLAADGLVFNGEIDQWTNLENYITGDLPGVKKYKDMLYDYMDQTSISIEVWNDIKLVSDLSKKVTDATKKLYVEEKISEMNSLLGKSGINITQEEWRIIDEMASNGVFMDAATQIDENNPLNSTYTNMLDETSGFGLFAKSMGLATKTISLVDITISGIEDMILLDSKMQTYYQYQNFLDDVIYARGIVPNELCAAAQIVKQEIEAGYWAQIKDMAVQFMQQSKITSEFKDSVMAMFGVESVWAWVKLVKLESWFINQIVDIGNMVKEAAYVEGYAYLAQMYKTRLQDTKTKFLNNMSEENAWNFYYDYNMLYSLRYAGEKEYLKMCKVKGLLGQLLTFGYEEKEEATNVILTNLQEKCKFDLGECVEVPKSMEYLEKMVISCPVNVSVYSSEGDLIAELVDGEHQDISNAYGRFVEVYNYNTGEYQKVVYLSQEDVKICVSAIDDGLVNFEYAYKNQQDEVSEKSLYNVPLKQGMVLQVLPTEAKNRGEITLVEGVNRTTLNLIEQSDYIQPENVSLSENSLVMKKGESRLLHVQVKPTNASYLKVVWKSLDSEIAEVVDGKVMAKQMGKTKIYGFIKGYSRPVECTVNVSEKLELPINDKMDIIDVPSEDNKSKESVEQSIKGQNMFDTTETDNKVVLRFVAQESRQNVKIGEVDTVVVDEDQQEADNVTSSTSKQQDNENIGQESRNKSNTRKMIILGIILLIATAILIYKILRKEKRN